MSTTTLIAAHLSAVHALAARILAAPTPPPKPASGSNLLLFVIPLALLAYLLLVRPQRQRARRTQQLQSSVEEGDTVVTIGGIVGRVVSLHGDRATIEVSPGMQLEVLRQAVARRIESSTPAAQDVAGPGGDGDGAGEGGNTHQEGHHLEDHHLEGHHPEGHHLEGSERDEAVDDEDGERGWHGYHPEGPEAHESPGLPGADRPAE